MIHDALLEAAHVQPVPAVTETAPVNAVDPTDEVVEEIVGAHGVPACVTVNVLPAIVAVPVREVLPGLAATL